MGNKYNTFLNKINNHDLIYRYILLFIGSTIVAFSYNLFFLRNNIVGFGLSGLSIVVKEFGVDSNLFILISSIILLIISFIILGKEQTKNSVIGSLLYPLMIYLTKPLSLMIDLEDTSLLLCAIFGAVISGIGYGIIYKTGFTTGGSDVVNQILTKYLKISTGSAMLFTDGLIVLSSKLVYTWQMVMYGIIILYIVSTISDKVIIGVSQTKAFYIVTEKDKEVKEFLNSLGDTGVSVFDIRGGYTNEKKKMLFSVIPTREYYILKEGLKEIDPNAFFLVTDGYEMSK